MESDMDKILKTLERISFSAIGLVAAIFILRMVMDLGPGSYGRTLLNGISVYMVIGSIILLLWVAYNVFQFSRPPGNSKK